MLDLKKILVPTDFSEGSRAAFNYACYLAKTLSATIEVLYVLETPYQINSEMVLVGTGNKNKTVLEFVQDQATTEMERFIGTIAKDTNITINTRIENGASYQQILRIAKEENIDLIVMGTHGRTGVSHAFLGSIAEKTLRNAPCPVLTIKTSS